MLKNKLGYPKTRFCSTVHNCRHIDLPPFLLSYICKAAAATAFFIKSSKLVIAFFLGSKSKMRHHHHFQQCLNCFPNVRTMEKVVLQAFLKKKPNFPHFIREGNWLRCNQTRGVTVHHSKLPNIVTESDCGELFENFKSFALHFKNSHFPYGPLGDLYCEECEEFFESPKEANIHHKKICASKNPFNCKFCGSVFKTFRALFHHEIRKHQQTECSSKHKCFVCHDIFDGKVSLSLLVKIVVALSFIPTLSACFRKPPESTPKA